MFITTLHKEKRLAQHAAEQLQNAPAPKSKRVQTGGDEVRIAALTPGVKHPQDVLMAALQQDQSALHLLTDVKKKIALKKEQLIPKWEPIIQNYRDSGAQHPFEPLVWFAIWCVDAGEFDQGIAWANFAIDQHQALPERFKSTNLESVITRQVHDWALEQFKAGHSAEPYLTQVVERIEANQWLVSEPALLGMLFKLVAMFAQKDNQDEKAESYFLKCVAANPEKHGVKGVLTKLQTKMGKPLTFA